MAPDMIVYARVSSQREPSRARRRTSARRIDHRQVLQQAGRRAEGCCEQSWFRPTTAGECPTGRRQAR